MNYQRVYEEFIADRRTKEEDLRASGEYFEVHHIRPRSLGGSNKKTNLIALSAQDHYRAHILLGAIHGGAMWKALNIMHDGKGDRRSCRSRTIYAMLKKKFARETSGVNHPRINLDVHTIYNADGRTATGAQYEIREQTGLTKTDLCALLRGRQHSVYGWCRTADEAANFVPHMGAVHTLYHIDGRTETGTQADLSRTAGVRHGNLSQVLLGKRLSVSDWYACPETAARAARDHALGIRGRIKDHRLYRFQKIETGEIVVATRKEMSFGHGIESSCLTRLMQGSLKSTHGWCLLGEDAASADVPPPRLSQNIVFELRHDDTGEVIMGNRREIGLQLSHLRSGTISPLLLGKLGHAKGWRLMSRSDQIAA
jgi:hypothetical protein